MGEWKRGRDNEREREREREEERKRCVQTFQITYPTFSIFRFNAAEYDLATIVPAVLICTTNLTVRKREIFFLLRNVFFIKFFFHCSVFLSLKVLL